MTIDERTRRELYLRLEAVLGVVEAETLMEHLPPVGWADVATRRDLDALRNEMEHGFSMVQSEFALARSEMATQKAEILTLIADRLRAQTWVLFSALVAGIGAAAAIARL
ncbi:MAG TPA: hypothetical protein VFF40_03845 [Acidimicrobiia bacterium]|nr:hypothetical protein [Acidimicrobiia bacterium]